jgi:hypothetical protein
LAPAVPAAWEDPALLAVRAVPPGCSVSAGPVAQAVPARLSAALAARAARADGSVRAALAVVGDSVQSPAEPEATAA